MPLDLGTNNEFATLEVKTSSSVARDVNVTQEGVQSGFGLKRVNGLAGPKNWVYIVDLDDMPDPGPSEPNLRLTSTWSSRSGHMSPPEFQTIQKY
ncbi:hypothetical protein TIFTF001_019451 [Ficus carica]|uniref:Uncharacterized protein n=1 Tax=Ficus carica TaxID=3494 RepID=A0AA88A907_FICCA|nr:hypothetical protein TIFTF001_019451 [Ficus carica]